MFGLTSGGANYAVTEVKDTDWRATLNSSYGLLQFGYAIIQTKGISSTRCSGWAAVKAR
jgi:hypothetical protein